MPFALVAVGMLLIITGFQNTYSQFGSQVAKDFTGEGNFIYWVVAIGVVGLIGYNKNMETFSRTFIALILVVIFLSNSGFAEKFTQALKEGTSTKPLPAGGIQASSGGGGGEGGGNFLSTVSQGASIISTIAGFL